MREIRRVSSAKKWQTNFIVAIIAIIIGTGFIIGLLGINSDLAHALTIIGGFSIVGLGIGLLLSTRTINKLERKLQLARNQQLPLPTKKWQSSLVVAIIAIIIGTAFFVGSPKNSDLGHALLAIGFLILGLGIGVLLSTRTIYILQKEK